MIENFDELKKQLNELSGVINSFKSESVQLEILKMIFTPATLREDNYNKLNSVRETKKYKNNKTKKSPIGTENSKTKKYSKLGPANILNQLIEEGFFDKPKTINEITQHSESSKGKKIKSGDYSSVLVRFIRDSKLKREKNNEGQYEYTKK